MNYSAARAPISAPRPPDRTQAGGRLPPPLARRSLSGQAPRSPVLAPPSHSLRPGSEVSLPPALSRLRLPPSSPERSALGPEARAAPVQGGGGDCAQQAHPQPAAGRPRGPEGTHVSLCSRPTRPLQGRPQSSRPRALLGRGATPGHCCPVPGAPAWARAEARTESPTRRIGVYPVGVVQTWGG